MKIKLGMQPMKLGQAAAYCGGELYDFTGSAGVEFSYICTDSREADKDTMFVAIRGERVDGHDYIGQAIAAVGGGNIADAVSVVRSGDMQNGYMELIESAVTLTKDIMGATDSALGNLEADNTSAILALQETSKIPLRQIRTSFYRCIEELALIWADMICAYYPNERLLPCKTFDSVVAKQTDLGVLKRNMLCATVDIAEVSRYSAATAQSMLDKLLDGNFITAEEYVKRIPSGIIPERQTLVEAIAERIKAEEEAKEYFESTQKE